MADTATMSSVEDRRRKTVKRKRAWSVLTGEDKESQIKELNEEMEGLFGYYREMITNQRLGIDLSESSGALNGMVAALVEESELPLSKLVDEIHVKLKEIGNEKLGESLAAVKNGVLFVGQRVMYGVSSADADVLEDHSDASLWCWETRDLKLLPKSVRGLLKIRRSCRKKIHERITAVSAMITALQKSESDPNFIHDLMKASGKLGKVLSEANIRVLVDGMLKKNGANMVEKDAKREERILIKQLEKNKREVEKEKKRMDHEQQKEKLQREKELKRLQEEAERDERRREKEEAEMRKQLRKQQEEAEKDQQRREKEEAELKKKLAVQKQISIMKRFLKRSKTATCQNDQSSSGAINSVLLSKNREQLSESVTKLIDSALSSNNDINIDDIRKYHLSLWHRFGHSVHSSRNQHWGIRRKPKTALIKELKLTNRGLGRDDDLSMERLEDRCEEQILDDRTCITSSDSSPALNKCKWRKQLLQFDKSHRPTFYGLWPKKSNVVGPRHPLTKDPDLDYDVDSDDEWEEEDPGESLSDCDKADDEENCSKADDQEESEDGFFVPDGYLSEDEGVEVDRMETDLSVQEAKTSPSCRQELESEESCTFLRQWKYLNNVTKHALRKNQPLIILNLMHEKIPLLMAEDLSGSSKMELTCLQALSIRPFPGDFHVEITVDIMEDENKEDCLSNGKGSTTPILTMTALSESDLPAIVSVIQSCSTSMNKILESLQQKFPSISRSQLRNKVREISDFNVTENRWQVKKELLMELGFSPDTSGGRVKSITAFFSKRCLPPER